MGRRRGGKAINGWLVVDKPRGTTSAAVVARARRIVRLVDGKVASDERKAQAQPTPE